MAKENKSLPIYSWEVLHLSSGHEGGAGLAARRLNSALLESNVKSKFLALAQPNFKPGQNEIAFSRAITKKLISGLLTIVNNKLSEKVFFSLFSVNVLSTKKIIKLRNSKTQIIHIHNWYNLISIRQISKLISAGFIIVFTMHDQRIYTGGCHYTFSCKNFKSDCVNCPLIPKGLTSIPLKIQKKLEKIIQNPEAKIYFIAPSEWMRKEAFDSKILHSKPIQFIPNSLGNFPRTKISKAWLSEVPTKIVIGVGSMDSSSSIKGGDIVLDLEKLIIIRKLNYKIIFLNNKLIQENPISNFWETINFLLVPSRADNSPNVIHEAKIHGIPVIATLVGGISELLDPDYDLGIPVDFLNAETILTLLDQYSKVRSNYSMASMISNHNMYIRNAVKMHIDLYENLALKYQNSYID